MAGGHLWQKASLTKALLHVKINLPARGAIRVAWGVTDSDASAIHLLDISVMLLMEHGAAVNTTVKENTHASRSH
jgi:hypothetical protein